MNTRPTTVYAASVTTGATVTTIPTVSSGRTTSDSFIVTDVDVFTINGTVFVELFHKSGSHTMTGRTPVVVG